MKGKMSLKLSNIILIALILFLIIFIVVFSINYLNSNKLVFKSKTDIKQSNNSLALMYETSPETGEYQVSTDSVWPTNGYAFNTSLSMCENGSILTYDATTNKVKVQSTKSDKCFIYFDEIQTIGKKCKNQNIASCIKTNYQLDNNINYHNSTLANGANDGSYRFSGANPNNYVCFGPGATAAGTACPEENQYRIIGVFGNQVKLIKKTSLGKMQWNSNSVKKWAGSTMDTYLNGEYLNRLTPTWSNKISINTWQVGGIDFNNVFKVVPAIAYSYEVGSNKTNVTSNSKIGLMYITDFGFATSLSNWTLSLCGYYDNINDYTNPSAKENNWLFTGSWEWIITCYLGETLNVYDISPDGSIHGGSSDNFLIARPVFYLESLINLVGGNGTAIDPYRIY